MLSGGGLSPDGRARRIDGSASTAARSRRRQTLAVVTTFIVVAMSALVVSPLGASPARPRASLPGASRHATQPPVTTPSPPGPALLSAPRSPTASSAPVRPATAKPADPPAPTAPPAARGETIYTGTAEVIATLLPTTVTPAIVFSNGWGATLATVEGQAVRAVAGTWTAIAPVVAIAPPSTTAAHLAMEGAPSGAVAVRDSSLTGAAAAIAPAVHGPLRTSGNQILDASGAPLLLRGVDFYDLINSPTPALDQQTFVEAREWGANLVRVSLVENFLVPGMCGYSPGYSSDVAQVVNWITSLGMVALLDLHLSSPLLCLPIGEQEMADDPGSLDFWNELASQYRSNPLVAFDLFNEPHDISDQVWLDGGTALDFVPYQAVGMQQLYDTVRATGAQNLVFISGNNWASTVPSTLVTGTNIVYSVHAYTCPNSTPPQCTASDPYDPSSILDPWLALSSTEPVFIGEFGWPSTSDGTYIRNVIAYGAAHGWGWDAYVWSDQPSNPYALATEDLSAGPWEPTPSGMPVVQALLAPH